MIATYPQDRTTLSGNRFVCTSSTRPANPFVGMEIYETDTRMTLVWEGAGWGPHWDRPWGLVATATKTSTQTTTSTSTVDITGLSVTFTATAGRKYLITGSCLMQSDVANDRASLVIRNGSGTQLQRRDPGTMSAASTPHAVTAEIIDTPSAGSVTYKLGFYRQGGSGTISAIGTSTIPAIISVYDVGPQSTLIGEQVYPANSNATNYQICTSSTRPSSPFPGMQIYETDTKNSYFYDTTLGWVPPWNTAWGRVAFASVSSDQTPITSVTDATGFSITFTAIAGRRYRLSSYGLFSSTAADNVVRLDICNSSNTVLVRGTGHIVAASNGIAVPAMCFQAPGAGSVTYKCRTQRQGGAGTITLANSVDNGFLSAEDVGPA